MPGYFRCVVAVFAVFYFAGNANASGRLDSPHTILNRLLERYVKLEFDFAGTASHPHSLVDYHGLQSDPRRKEYRDALLRVESSVIRSSSGNDQKAFWINCYNATVLHAVVSHYPIELVVRTKNPDYPANSIQQIPQVWETRYSVAPGALSLNEIQQKLRELRDPRVYFALCNAATGSPILRNKAYNGTNIEELLERAVSEFIADPQNYNLNMATAELGLSDLFRLHLPDFADAVLETPPQARAYSLDQRGLIAFRASSRNPPDRTAGT